MSNSLKVLFFNSSFQVSYTHFLSVLLRRLIHIRRQNLLTTGPTTDGHAQTRDLGWEITPVLHFFLVHFTSATFYSPPDLSLTSKKKGGGLESQMADTSAPIEDIPPTKSGEEGEETPDGSKPSMKDFERVVRQCELFHSEVITSKKEKEELEKLVDTYRRTCEMLTKQFSGLEFILHTLLHTFAHFLRSFLILTIL
jgi:hypothetical protein